MKRRKKRTIGVNYKCVVCNCTFIKPKVDNDKSKQEESSKVFDAFCTLLNLNPNHNDINNEEDKSKDYKWDFNRDGLPFCSECVILAQDLYNLYDVLEKAHLDIYDISSRIKKTVLSTTNNENEQKIRNTNNNIDRAVQHLRLQIINQGPHITSTNEVPEADVGSQDESFTDARVNINQEETRQPRVVVQKCEKVLNEKDLESKKTDNDADSCLMWTNVDMKSEPSSSPEHDPFEGCSSNMESQIEEPIGNIQTSSILEGELEYKSKANVLDKVYEIKAEITAGNNENENENDDDDDDEYMPSENDDTEEEDEDNDDEVVENYTCENQEIIFNSRITKTTQNNPSTSIPDTNLNEVIANATHNNNNSTTEKDQNHVELENDNNTIPKLEKPKLKRGRKSKYPPPLNEIPRVIKKRRRFVFEKKKFHFVDAEGFITFQGVKIQVIENNQFKCSSCETIYKHRRSVYNHIAHTHSVENKTLHECTLCDRKFRLRSLLETHLRKHDRPSYLSQVIHKCGFCNVSFSRREDLRNHIAECHQNAIPRTEDKQILISAKPRKVLEKCPDRDGFMCGDIYVQLDNNGWYCCSICTERKTFRYRHHMVRHLIIYHSGKSEWVKCPLCEKLFPEAWEVKTHVMEVHEGRVHSCPICKTNSNSAASLRVHMKSHTKEELDALNPNRDKIMFRNVEIKPVEGGFVCSKCPNSYVYKLKHSLNTHIIRHHQDKSNWVPCEICGKQFMSPWALRLHMQLHENKKQFVCDICNKGFNRKNTLFTHKKFHDRDSLPFPCPHCNMRFHAKGNLIKHIRAHSNKKERPFKCPKCFKDYCTKETLRHHACKEVKPV